MLFLCDCFALGSPHPRPTSERPLRRAVLSVPLSGRASVDLQTGRLARRGARAFPPHIWADAVPPAGALHASSSSASSVLLLLLVHPPENRRTSPQHSVRRWEEEEGEGEDEEEEDFYNLNFSATFSTRIQ